ncbi:hypothetical protein [Geodermatophilus sp. SYSU D00710]
MDPTLLDDGLSVAFWTTGTLWLLFALLAAPLTGFLRRRTPLSARSWWSVSVALWSAPFVAVDLIGMWR